MTSLPSLWLPMLVSTVLVFIVSSIVHMLPLWHRNDYPKIPNEDAVMAALRPLALPVGTFLMPRGAAADMRSPEYVEKLKAGPVAMLTVRPSGTFSMTPMLVQWFIYCAVVSLFAAYIPSRALAPGANRVDVLRLAGTTAFLAYAAALVQSSIWYWRPWSYTFKSTVDGVIYALLTAGVFAWLWPR